MAKQTDSRPRRIAAATNAPLSNAPLFAALVVLFLVLPLAAGCGGASGEPSAEVEPADPSAGNRSLDETARYNFVLDGRHRGGRLTVTANGFPVQENTGMIRYRQTRARLNTALVGEGNVVELRSEPLLMRSGDRLQMPEEHSFGGQVKRSGEPMAGTEITNAEINSAYASWKQRAEAEWERLLAWERSYVEAHPDSALAAPGGFTSRRGGALDSLRAWAERHPLVVRATFDAGAGAPDFSAIFEEAPRIEGTEADSARLTGYAMRLRDLFAEGDAEALYEEFAMSLNPSNPKPRSEILPRLRKLWIEQSPYNLDFERETIGLKKWSGGRVWEIYRKPNDPLFTSTDGGLRKVYIAEIDGDLKVVR